MLMQSSFCAFTSLTALLLVLLRTEAAQVHVASELFSAVNSCQAQFNRFRVEWSNLTLQILHTEYDQVVWSTIPNNSFVGSGSGSFKVTQTYGNFEVHSKADKVTESQSVLVCTSLPDSLTLSGEISNSDDKQTYLLTVSEDAVAGVRLQLRAFPQSEGRTSPGAYNRLRLRFASADSEKFYGFGVQYTYLDLKGQVVPVLVTEQGVGRGLRPITKYLNSAEHGAGGSPLTTYAPMPYYVTSFNRGLLLHSSRYSVFDLSRTNAVQVEVYDPKLSIDISVLGGDSMLDVISAYTKHTGRMSPLPEWAHKRGAVLGLQGGTQEVQKRLAQIKAAGAPVAAVWLQDWTGQRQDAFGTRLLWNWEVDLNHYPGWGGFVTSLQKEGIRMMTYINPHVTTNATSFHPYLHRDLFEEGRHNGYLVKNVDGDPYIQASASPAFQFGTVDLTNPAARTWYANIISCNMLCVCNASLSSLAAPEHLRDQANLTCGNGHSAEVGALGWMADFGEYLPFDAQLYAGSAAEVHNDYPRLWAELNQQAVQQAGMEGDAVYFMRSSFVGAPKATTVNWLGDQLVTWDSFDGLQSAVIGALSSGLSGISMTHSDIGGFTNMNLSHTMVYLRSKELLLRWCEMSAFSDVVFRTHLGNLPTSAAQIYSDDATLRHFARFARVHQALGHFRQQLMTEAQSTGAPLVRPLFLHFPQAFESNASNSQFLVGKELLVAPVLRPGVLTQQVWLPPGEWEHLWTCKTELARESRWVQVDAHIGSPPVFFWKAGNVGNSLQAALNISCRTGLVSASGSHKKQPTAK
ncbi:hypothetical protein CYMTET_43080 [Cymbomonas tetramitiformis]|uniref:Alpha-glucosidase n=1 Tax=Cymbomonas tetramitiformis TaxID=36881 RepID=A0AAE0C2X7_9CHLO|nr:hypothetical protein CYMTET_43080 [Cymbomonas tetramitiformis]